MLGHRPHKTVGQGTPGRVLNLPRARLSWPTHAAAWQAPVGGGTWNLRTCDVSMEPWASPEGNVLAGCSYGASGNLTVAVAPGLPGVCCLS